MAPFRRSTLLFVLLVSTFGPIAAHAEVVFSNLNTSSGASYGNGFTNYAQRFSTLSAGTGVQVGLNLFSLSGSQSYTIELWSADGAGTGVSALLTSIGSGSVTATDRVAVTSFSSSFALAPSTHYFIKITAASGNLGIALGPNSNTVLNSVTRYGVGNLNNTTTSAIGMEVTVATAPTFPVLAELLAGLDALAGFRRRRISDVS